MAEKLELQYYNNNAKFQKKLHYGVHQNFLKANVIKDHVLNYISEFPKKRIKKGETSDFLVDKETGEYFYKLVPMVNAYFDLTQFNWGVYAIFKKPDQSKQHMVSAFHSKNKFDSVFNMRKRQRVCAIWRNYLSETKIYKDFDVIHLVLTVPHKDGLYKGKRYYAGDIIRNFNLMRKNKKFLKYIHGGEYGVEHTYTEKNGFHIHLHCLVFQKKGFKVNEVREDLQKIWAKLTGGGRLWYETLYVYQKDENDNWVMNYKEQVVEYDEIANHTEYETIRYRKKFRLGEQYKWFRGLPEDEKLNMYLFGILECIKYHFKGEVFSSKEKKYDPNYIEEVLNNYKGLRMYAKFGAFYREERLNYTQKTKDAKQTTIDFDGSETETDEYNEIKADVDNAVSKIVNPFTMQFAEREEYHICISPVTKTKVLTKADNKTIVQAMGDPDYYFEVRQDFNFKEILKTIYQKDWHALLTDESYSRFCKLLLLRKLNLN